MAMSAPANGVGSALPVGLASEYMLDRAFDINDPAFCSDEFRMYEFKVTMGTALHVSVNSHAHVVGEMSAVRGNFSLYERYHVDRSWFPQIQRCPRARPHDWTGCPFAHPDTCTTRDE